MEKPKNSLFLTIASVCAIAILFSARASITDTNTVYLAHTLPESHPVHLGMEVFAKETESLSQGKLKVKIFPDGQLGTEREVLELLQIGSVAMTKVSAATMANFAPAYKVLGIPYLFRDKQHLFSVLEGEVGASMLAAGSEYRLRGLCFYDAGSRSFYTKEKPIRRPEDLAGLKIRVMNHQLSVEMVNEMGGSATPMAYSELYTALQQGVVDGAENNPPSFVTSGHYEVCKYYTLDEHSSIPDVLVIGTPFWNKLSSQEQAWLHSAAQSSAAAQREFWQDDVKASFTKLKAAGVEIITPEKSLFSTKTKAIIDELKEDQQIGPLIQQIQQQ